MDCGNTYSHEILQTNLIKVHESSLILFLYLLVSYESHLKCHPSFTIRSSVSPRTALLLDDTPSYSRLLCCHILYSCGCREVGSSYTSLMTSCHRWICNKRENITPGVQYRITIFMYRLLDCQSLLCVIVNIQVFNPLVHMGCAVKKPPPGHSLLCKSRDQPLNQAIS